MGDDAIAAVAVWACGQSSVIVSLSPAGEEAGAGKGREGGETMCTTYEWDCSEGCLVWVVQWQQCLLCMCLGEERGRARHEVLVGCVGISREAWEGSWKGRDVAWLVL